MSDEETKMEVSQLRHSRGILKSKLTRFEKFLKVTTNQSNFVQIEIRLKGIEEDMREFENVQSRLEFLDENEEIERENIEMSYYQLMSLARQYLLNHSTSQASSTSIQQAQPSLTPNIGKLPDLGLPTFYGNYETWLGFYEIYSSIIHSRSDLPDIQKFLYLKTCCKGAALKIIDNLEITASNYEIALALLKSRFENKRAIINHHINTLLFKLPDVKRETAQDIRILIDTVTQHISALEKLCLPVEYWDSLLIPIILRKIDDRSKREWEGKLENNKLPTLKEFLDFLTKKYFTLEALYNDNPNKNTSLNSNFRSNNRDGNKGKQSPKPHNLQICYTGSEGISCKLCHDTHFIYQCPTFLSLSLNDKYQEIRKHKLCSNCLRSGHFKTQCQSGNCRKCNMKHSTLLHDDNFKNWFNRRESPSGTGNPVVHQISSPMNSQQNYVNKATHVVAETQLQEPGLRAIAGSAKPRDKVNENPTNEILSNEGQYLPSNHIVGNVYEVSNTSVNKDQVLLSTAKILIEDGSGKFHECVALLDSGSQSNLISQSLSDKLRLKCEKFHVPLAGINQIVTSIKSKTSAKIKSRFGSFESTLTFLVLPVITEKLPLVEFPKNIVKMPPSIQLADEKFNEPKVIDLLLGASIFYELLGTGKMRLGGKNMPMLQETLLGWILTGTIILNSSARENAQKTICNFVQQDETNNLNQLLTKFWQIEELPQEQILSPEAQYCEELFKRTTRKNEDGRFIVKLPFIENVQNKLGNSKNLCLKRFLNMESRLQRNEILRTQYVEFMKEYETLNHMTLKCDLHQDNSIENESYFIPHHPIIRDSSLTTQCRVVFDASFKTNKDVSLNELLCLGPTVQDDLFSIVLRFRLRSVVLNADIKMMYRQILIDPSDRPYQQILWRSTKNQPIQVYFLNTVTYGTKSAPYLATRCLKQVAIENQRDYPRTSKIIETSFYMDDLILTVDSVKEALEIYKEITKILSQCGFQLRKWCSNEHTVLNYIKNHSSLQDDKLVLPHDNKELKMLGISWIPVTDCFKYVVQINSNYSQITKRSVLSILSQIYDPLGLIGPALIKGKILIQRLWQLQLEWDEPIPEDLKNFWTHFLSQIPVLNQIQIKRQVLQHNHVSVELHGFSDASIKAYGAALYLCSVNEEGKRSVQLLCGKSKVAPLKKVTLPRLELLAAFLLAKLTNTIKNTLDVEISKTILYTDSTIVLSWLKIEPSLLKTFVGNRVAKITELTDINEWKHVRSEDNAADIISRGIEPEELIGATMWWHGPSFLRETDPINIPMKLFANNSESSELPEVKGSLVTLITAERLEFDIFNKYSTLSRLQGVIAYMLRFKKITLNKIKYTSEVLTVNELSESLEVLIKLAQLNSFPREVNCLKKNKGLDRNSKILSLHPFLDPQGILRVGGRLLNAKHIEFDQKCPIILPYKHQLTELIIKAEHIKNLHAGVQNLLSILRLTYWPINGKNMVKKVIGSCIKCFRVKPNCSKFLMGQLPYSRVTPSRPFSQCAVDYAGPIFIKDGVRRKSQLIKAYICIFVCLAVRAVHIELVHDLTTDSFLNALKRFISRRGKPNDIYSDNGLNFVGANNYFVELYNLLSADGHNNLVTKFLAKDKINWHFIPAKSPHMGGLWEAAVKSVKYHLRRVLGNATLHYEEMCTVLVQIEACLNSRPLTPLSNDPNDFLPLTPAHFLIGNSLACTPQADVKEVKHNRLNRYSYMQQLLQHFWSRWSCEYLSQLQTRTKWKTNVDVTIKIGSLVIMIEDNMPPLKWPMARVIELHPGTDKILRVVTVRVASGKVFKRSLSKICVLPIETD